MTDRRDAVPDDDAPGEGERDPEPAAPDVDLDDVLAYEDDGVVVLCDRSNPEAWIEADHAVDLPE